MSGCDCDIPLGQRDCAACQAQFPVDATTKVIATDPKTQLDFRAFQRGHGADFATAPLTGTGGHVSVKPVS